MWQVRGQVLLTQLDQIGWKRERGKEKRKPDLKREFERERLHLLSNFPGDRTGDFKRSKRKSSSSQQGVCIETGIGEFRQNPRGRFSPTLITFYPKGCVVVVLP